MGKLLQFGENGALRAKRARFRQSDNVSDGEDDKPDALRSKYANKESLFRNADDFWAMFGWAMNCSVAHKPRWYRWNLWLDFVLDVLERDLISRHVQTKQGPAIPIQAQRTTMEASLIARYLAPYSGEKIDLISGEITVKAGVKKKKRVYEKAAGARSRMVFERVLSSVRRLSKVVLKNEGLSNKELSASTPG